VEGEERGGGDDTNRSRHRRRTPGTRRLALARLDPVGVPQKSRRLSKLTRCKPAAIPLETAAMAILALCAIHCVAAVFLLGHVKLCLMFTIRPHECLARLQCLNPVAGVAVRQMDPRNTATPVLRPKAFPASLQTCLQCRSVDIDGIASAANTIA
jgi:hypothetical protein